MAVEIDETELATLRRAAQLLGRMNGNPKSRTHLERAVKEEFPEVVTEEEQITRFAAPHVEKLQSKIDGLEGIIKERFEREDKARQERIEREAEDSLRAQFSTLKKNGFTDEGIGKVVEIMTNENVASVDAAVALFEKRNPPAREVASAWEPQTWKVADDNSGGPTTKDWFTDPEGTSDRVIADTLRDIRSASAA